MINSRTQLNNLPPSVLTDIFLHLPVHSLSNLWPLLNRTSQLLLKNDRCLWSKKLCKIFIPNKLDISYNAQLTVGNEHLLQELIYQPPFNQVRCIHQVESVQSIIASSIEMNTSVSAVCSAVPQRLLFGNFGGCIGFVHRSGCPETGDYRQKFEIQEFPYCPHWILSISYIGNGISAVACSDYTVDFCDISQSKPSRIHKWNLDSCVSSQFWDGQLLWAACLDGRLAGIDHRSSSIVRYLYSDYAPIHISRVDYENDEQKQRLVACVPSRHSLFVFDIRGNSNSPAQRLVCPESPQDFVNGPLGVIVYKKSLQRCHMTGANMVLDEKDYIDYQQTLESSFVRAISQHGLITAISKSGQLNFINPFTLETLWKYVCGQNRPQLGQLSSFDFPRIDLASDGESLWALYNLYNVTHFQWPSLDSSDLPENMQC